MNHFTTILLHTVVIYGFVAVPVETATFCQNTKGNSKHEHGCLGAMVFGRKSYEPFSASLNI